MIFNALERGPEVDTSDQTLSSDAWLTFSGSNKPYVPEAWRRHKSRSEMRLLREISREISTSYFYYHVFFSLSLSLSLSDLLDFRIFFFFSFSFPLVRLFFLLASIPMRHIDIVNALIDSRFLISGYWHSAIWRLWTAGYYCARRRCLTIGRWDRFLWSPR